MRPAWSGFRRAQPNPLVCGRKFCSKCGRWRYACDFALVRTRGFLRLDSYCRGCRAGIKRKEWARRTPAQRDLRREYVRFWKEAQRRKNGVPERQCRRVTVIDRAEQVFLPIAPLLGEIDRWLQLDQPEWRRNPERSVENLAALAGINARTINRFQNGQSRRIRIDVADKLAVALDIPMPLIWPDDEEMAA